MVKPPAVLHRILKGIALLASGFVVLFCLYLFMLWRHTQQVRSFCSDAQPGTAIDSLPKIAERHHIDQTWLRGTESRTPGMTFIFVPIPETIGEEGCAIEHDGKTVRTSKLHAAF